jgi:hypothetical protein
VFFDEHYLHLFASASDSDLRKFAEGPPYAEAEIVLPLGLELFIRD